MTGTHAGVPAAAPASTPSFLSRILRLPARPGGGRFRRLFAALALAAVPLLAAAPEARAEVLIGNLNIGTASSNIVSPVTETRDVAQGFRTGSHAAGYSLESVSLFFDATISAGDIGDLAVTIRSNDSGRPGTTLWTLANPASIEQSSSNDNPAVFTAPADTVLDANTTYFVVLDFDRSGYLWGIQEYGEESGGAAGWSIANTSWWWSGSLWVGDNGDDVYLIRVNGAAITVNATGAPAITGTAQVTETLTAGIGTIADADGLPATFPDDYDFQWIRVDADGTSNPAEIAGATSSTYTLAGADLGKKLQVRVSFEDDGGNRETLTSAAYPAGTATVTNPDPAIFIAPDRPKANGRFDWIHYTLTREGPTTDAATVTVTLVPPPGNDWEIDDDEIDHEVTFAAGEATQRLSIKLTSGGPGNIGFSTSRARMSGTLGASLGAVTGYDTSDTAEVEVVVVPNPLWIARMTQPAWTFEEGGGAQVAVLEVRAASAAMPAPSSEPDGDSTVEVSVSTDPGTAASPGDYAASSQMLEVPTSAFGAGADGIQRGRVQVPFTVVDDSDAEGSETAFFKLERAPLVPRGYIAFEGPDGSVDDDDADYPITILDDDFGVTGVEVTSTPGHSSDTYGVGDQIHFTVTFSLPATVTGSPHFEFSLGGDDTEAPYLRGSGTTELVFAYTVQSGDMDADGIWVGDQDRTIKLDSGEHIRNGSTDATLSHAEVGTLAGHKVDGSASPGGPPGPPVGLTASVVDRTGVALAWSAPSSIGGSAITGYRIEWSDNGSTWRDAVPNTGDTATTRTVTVPAGETGRWFRILAINDQGAGSPSDVARTGNRPATGTPTISGTGRVGQMLTADASAIADDNGLTGVSFTYRWVRIDGTTETDVGTDAATYMPVAADAGHRIKVVVSFTDYAGFAEARESAAVAVRAAMPPATCPAFTVPPGREQVWTATLTVGALEFSGVTSHYGYAAGFAGMLSETGFDLGSDRLLIQALLVPATGGAGPLQVGGDLELTAGQRRNLRLHVCGETYAFSDADVVTQANTRHNWARAGLDWSGLVGMTRELYLTVRANNPATGQPAVTGAARVGQTLRAGRQGIRDADGLSDPGWEYQWLREDTDGSSQAEIAGATSRDYELTADDAGKRVRVKVSFTDDLGNGEAATSEPFPASGSIARPAPMRDPGDLLSATLDVRDFGSGRLGCDQEGANRCSDSNVLTDNDFTIGSTSRTILQIGLRTNGAVFVLFNGAFDSAQRDVLSIEFGSTTFRFRDASRTGGGNQYEWSSSGLSWSAGDDVSVTIKDAGTGDVTPPALSAADTDTDGDGITLTFDEDLDESDHAADSAFTVTADGTPIAATFDGAAGQEYYLSLSPPILRGQTVVVTYTDPTSGDDENAIQDEEGNDAASFTAEVENRSTAFGVPGKPTGLTAEEAVSNLGRQIDLAWMAPSDTGASAITGYRIEWSADGSAPWTVLEELHDEMLGGAILLAYSDAGLRSPTTRHYRVSATNDQGTGAASDTAHATTTDVAGPVLRSAWTGTTGEDLVLAFDENVAPDTNLPPISALTVTADGVVLAIGSLATLQATATHPVSLLLDDLSPVIRRGQTVVVAYADPNPGDDGRAIQDFGLNDAESFTTGAGGAPAVENRSTVEPVVPGAPESVEAEPGGDTSIIVTWDPPADNGGRVVTSYRIEVSEDGATRDWQELVDEHAVMQGGAIETRYEHAGLEPGTTRHYRVRAENSVGDGAWSAEATAETTSGAPDVPTNLMATPGLPTPRDGTTLVTLTWQAPADIGDSAITGYRIEYSEDGDPLVWQDLVADTGTTALTHVDEDLPSETVRHYRVRAINDDGTGPPSNVAMTTTADIAGPEPQSASVPAAGTSVAIVFDEALDATASRLPQAERFTVTAGDGARFRVGSVAVSGMTVTVNLHADSAVIRTGQALTVAYTDRTTGDDASGVVQDDDGNDAAAFTLGPSETVSVTNGSTEAAGAPGAPENVAARGAGGDRIRVTWEAPADTGGRAVTGYRIEVSTDGTDFTVLVADHTGSLEYLHTGLGVGDRRWYRVAARNAPGAAGLGPTSEVARGITVHPDAPSAPQNLDATPGLPSPPDGTTLIRLTWEAPADIGGSAIEGYRIEVSTDGANFTELVADTGTTARTYTHTGLPSQATRQYRVSAINGQGTGLPSESYGTRTADIVPPVPQSASVPAAGTSVAIVFDEALASSASLRPAVSSFAVTGADGARFRVGSVAVSGMTVTLELHAASPVIRTGQAVTVVYTDPSPNDDGTAIQDDSELNDAASFTLGPGESVTVTNGSTQPAGAPGAPVGLEAVSGGDDRIELTWEAPADTGGRAITGYRIEVSTDGNAFTELVADTGTTATSYTHTGLGVGDQRWYRVAARNAPGAAGLGPASAVATGVVDLKGRLALTVDAAGVSEGGTATWTVTATTDEDEAPESGLQMQVRVVSEDGTATAPGDYAAVDETVTFRRSDFARETVPGVGQRWVARKTGPVTVEDDPEVEAEEDFALAMSIAGGGTGWVRDARRVDLTVPNEDAWSVAVTADPAEIVEGETREVALTARILPEVAEDECVLPFPVTVSLAVTGTAVEGTDYARDGATGGREIAACTPRTSWRVSLTADVDTVDDDGETIVFAPEVAGTPEPAPESLAAATVTVREGKGVVLGALALTLDEGGSASYTAVLTSRPTGTVGLVPSVSGDGDVTVAPARLEFGPGNWNLPQTLTVRAAHDGDDEDDAAEVSHALSGADYAGVTAGGVRVAVLDDDKSFGSLRVRLSDGRRGAGTQDPPPATHHGETFWIELWWSELRTHDYERPHLAIGDNRAIRVTGASVRPVEHWISGEWDQASLILQITPRFPGSDVTLVLEPMDCSYPHWQQPSPNPRALCAHTERGRGEITGLAERVRWTVRGIGGAPPAPANLTLESEEFLTVTGSDVTSRTVLFAAFDAELAGARWRVQAQAPGGGWTDPRVWAGAKHGTRHRVQLGGLDPDGAWEVRARWENRWGSGPWAEVRTAGGPPLAAPRGLAAAQEDDGRSVALTWIPGSSTDVARYQVLVGRIGGGLETGWRDIPDSGPGAANRRSVTLDGLERTWEIQARLRAVDVSGRAGAATDWARVPEAAPRVLTDRIRVLTDPGPDGAYAVGDLIEVAVRMSRPVRQQAGGPLSSVTLDMGGTRTPEAVLDRIADSSVAADGSYDVSAHGSGDTLVFAYRVKSGDDDPDGIGIGAGGLNLNGGRLIDASPGSRGLAASFRLDREVTFPGHAVQGVLPRVTGVERLGNRVWINYERDLDPESGIDQGVRQFFPHYSVSQPFPPEVRDVRIVRGRGWEENCRRTAREGCRTVLVTLGAVRRPNSGGDPGTVHQGPLPDERVWLSYRPKSGYRLRDAVGHEAPGFSRMEALPLQAGADPVLSVSDATGYEGRPRGALFTVRLVPAATSEVSVDYATAEGWTDGETVRPNHRFMARENTDFRPVSGRLVFAPGETSKTVEVPIVNDTVPDSGEIFALVLANASGARLGDPVGRGTIRNHEELTASFGSLPRGHDGETAFTVGLTFSEEVALDAAALRDGALAVTGGAVTGVRRTDAASTKGWEVTVAPSGEEDVTLSLARVADCGAAGAVCTPDGLALEAGIAATVAWAPVRVEVAGAPQVGGRVEVRWVGTLKGQVSYEWLRDGAPIGNGALGRTYAPAAADVGHRLSVRARVGGRTLTSAETGPVWAAPVAAPLAAGEAELLSATLTLEAEELPFLVAGYGRALGRSWGEMDDISFEDGGEARQVTVFSVNQYGTFVLATGDPLPEAAGLVAYWNGHRIGGLEAGTAGGVAVLTGRMPERAPGHYRPWADGSSDGMRVAVSLRRVTAAARVTAASTTSDPGGNGVWDAGETVEAALEFSAPVTLTAPAGAAPTLAVLLDGVRREAAWTGGSGTERLTFSYRVTAADAGARKARVAPDGLDLDGATLSAGGDGIVDTGYAVPPWIAAVALMPDASGDGRWDAGEAIEVRVTFSEPVTVSGGAPWLDVSIGGLPGAVSYASGSGNATLTFSYEVPAGARSFEGLTVVPDSLRANGARIVSAASGLAAELGHDGAEPGVAPEAPAPLTAELRDVPHAHGGASFTLELRFGEEVTGLSYLTLRDRAFAVSGGGVAGARRLDGASNRRWEIRVVPAADAGDVTVTLPAIADCAATGAVCTEDGRGLATAVSATVPRAVASGAAFRVRLADVPAEHDGATAILFEVAFNREPGPDYSYVTMRDSTLRVRQGDRVLSAAKARRLNQGQNDRWEIEVVPSSKEDLAVSVGPFASCSETGAVCTGDGAVLSNAATATVLGPPGLSVADAHVYEAANATLEFAVTLGRASASAVSVDYATSDGTATAGEDYTATTGTLTFAAGETAKTVPVPVLGDDHDEGEETLTLTLSNPSGGNAWLKDATATGTIENSDAMPRAWLARFGRTVAEQVLEAVEGRFRAARAPGVEAMLAGEALPFRDGPGAGNAEQEDAAARRKALAEEEARSRLEAMTRWLAGTESGVDRRDSRAVTGRDLLTGTSFALTGGSAERGLVSFWGRGAVSRFDGREPGAGGLTLSGEVASAMLGADWARERWTAGLLLSRSEGEGSWRGEGAGEVSSTLTGLFPYGRYLVNDRLTLWGVTGRGEGELVLTPADGSPMRTDMDLAMGAAGMRGVAVEAGPEGGVELAVTSDATAVRTASERTEGLEAAEADVTRLRLGLEGTWRGLEVGGGPLVPRLEVGLRHDGGDAETGFGLDLGGGLSWSHPESGLSAVFSGRGLLTHESQGFRDRGLSGSFAWDPGQGSGRGPSLTLTQAAGASASGGMGALLRRETLAGLAANDNGAGNEDLANRRLELRMGYGFPAFGNRFTSAPELSLGLSDGQREYGLGWRLSLVRGGGTNALELTLDATRREQTGANDNTEPEHGVRFGITARW